MGFIASYLQQQTPRQWRFDAKLASHVAPSALAGAPEAVRDAWSGTRETSVQGVLQAALHTEGAQARAAHLLVVSALINLRPEALPEDDAAHLGLDEGLGALGPEATAALTRIGARQHLAAMAEALEAAPNAVDLATLDARLEALEAKQARNRRIIARLAEQCTRPDVVEALAERVEGQAALSDVIHRARRARANLVNHGAVRGQQIGQLLAAKTPAELGAYLAPAVLQRMPDEVLAATESLLAQRVGTGDAAWKASLDRLRAVRALRGLGHSDYTRAFKSLPLEARAFAARGITYPYRFAVMLFDGMPIYGEHSKEDVLQATEKLQTELAGLSEAAFSALCEQLDLVRCEATEAETTERASWVLDAARQRRGAGPGPRAPERTLPPRNEIPLDPSLSRDDAIHVALEAHLQPVLRLAVLRGRRDAPRFAANAFTVKTDAAGGVLAVACNETEGPFSRGAIARRHHVRWRVTDGPDGATLVVERRPPKAPEASQRRRRERPLAGHPAISDLDARTQHRLCDWAEQLPGDPVTNLETLAAHRGLAELWPSQDNAALVTALGPEVVLGLLDDGEPPAALQSYLQDRETGADEVRAHFASHGGPRTRAALDGALRFMTSTFWTLPFELGTRLVEGEPFDRLEAIERALSERPGRLEGLRLLEAHRGLDAALGALRAPEALDERLAPYDLRPVVRAALEADAGEAGPHDRLVEQAFLRCGISPDARRSALQGIQRARARGVRLDNAANHLIDRLLPDLRGPGDGLRSDAGTVPSIPAAEQLLRRCRLGRASAKDYLQAAQLLWSRQALRPSPFQSGQYSAAEVHQLLSTLVDSEGRAHVPARFDGAQLVFKRLVEGVVDHFDRVKKDAALERGATWIAPALRRAAEAPRAAAAARALSESLVAHDFGDEEGMQSILTLLHQGAPKHELVAAIRRTHRRIKTQDGPPPSTLTSLSMRTPVDHDDPASLQVGVSIYESGTIHIDLRRPDQPNGTLGVIGLELPGPGVDREVHFHDRGRLAEDRPLPQRQAVARFFLAACPPIEPGLESRFLEPGPEEVLARAIVERALLPQAEQDAWAPKIEAGARALGIEFSADDPTRFDVMLAAALEASLYTPNLGDAPAIDRVVTRKAERLAPLARTLLDVGAHLSPRGRDALTRIVAAIDPTTGHEDSLERLAARVGEGPRWDFDRRALGLF